MSQKQIIQPRKKKCIPSCSRLKHFDHIGSAGEQNEPIIHNNNFDCQKTFEYGARSKISACSVYTENNAGFDKHTPDPQDSRAVVTNKEVAAIASSSDGENCVVSKSSGCGATFEKSRCIAHAYIR